MEHRRINVEMIKHLLGLVRHGVFPTQFDIGIREFSSLYFSGMFEGTRLTRDGGPRRTVASLQEYGQACYTLFDVIPTFSREK